MGSNTLLAEIEHLRHTWGWVFGLGMLMVVLGIIALFMIPVATAAAVLGLGWLMLFSGIVEGVHAFRVRNWSGAFLHIVLAIIGVFTGLLVITHPLAGALAFTLLFASFLTVVGVFRIIAALRLKFLHWKWAVFDGAITLALGVVLWAEWPVSGYWFLGLAVAISLMLRGWSYAMMAIAVRSLPGPMETRDTRFPRAA